MLKMEDTMKDKERLTILVGAGAVVEISKISTSSITTEILSSNKIHTSSKTLFSKIYSDLLINNQKWDNYTPNFEDIFHGLEILAGLFTIDNAAPEFKPIYKYFTTIKDDYQQFDPYKNYPPKIDTTLGLAFSDLLKIITDNIESYSTLPVTDWYQNFFLDLGNHYNLDIFNLNYDNLFEKIFKDYNDGFKNSKDNGTYIEFNPHLAMDTTSHAVNINHLHGQIDFTFINNPEIAKRDFDDDNFYTIYKLKKDVKNGHIRYAEGNFENTQNGEHLKQTTIITGKNKTEKIAIPPFDTYRANLQKCIIQNPNLLIIGYGFADYYVNNILKQFNKIHKENKRVNIIDFANETDWNDKIHTKEQISETKFRTLYGIFKDENVETMLKEEFTSPQLFNNDLNRLYLRGFKNATENNIGEIIDSYRRA